MIRIATPADVPGMFEVRTNVRENHLSLQELAEYGITPMTLPSMLSGSGRGWVACAALKVVVFAMVDADEAALFALFVHPEYEGLGLGRRLMAVAEEWLTSRGCREIWLLTDADPKVRANGFYRYLGWQAVGIEEDGQMRFVKCLGEGTPTP
ncbi:MAG: GNAT family N-acetyltransferase [Aeromonas hydrophila]